MSIDADELARIAQAYVEFLAWFVREGAQKFQQHQAKVRQRFSPQFGAIVAAITQGPSALWKALEASASAFQENLDVLAFEEHPAQWADQRVRDLLAAGGPTAWSFLVEIVRRAPDDVLGSIGAGPFESWVTEERVVEVRSELTRLLRQDPRFGQVVRASWEVPPTLQAILAELDLTAAGGG
jgi:hypothetical protein